MSAQNRVSFAKIDFPANKQPQRDEPTVPSRPVSRFSVVTRFLAGFMFVVLCVAIAWPLLPRRYESTASVILRPTDADGRLDSIQSLRQPLDENAIQSEMDIIGSPTIASAVINHHNLANDPEFAEDRTGLRYRLLESLYQTFPATTGWFGQLRVGSDAELREQLQKHLSVSRDRRSYTVKMGYWSSDPAKAAALTDTLLNAYLGNQLSRKRGSADQHSAWLIERVEALRGKYDNSERAVREFALSSERTDGAMLRTLESQRAALSLEAADIRGKLNAVPQVESTRQARSGTATLLQAPSSALEARATAIEKTLGSLREEIAERQLAVLKLEALQREAAIDKDLLDGALVRLKAQEPRLSSVGPGVEILARPDPALRPTFPNGLLFAFGTLIAAIAAGIAMAWNPRSRDGNNSPSGR